ncbi:MAG: molybdopterin molybdotransferase MoeA [Verrucomicrobiota bacterium]|nr:molybdopterin molybdotransferase MoeA [Limisphaera sp.]MDW8381823.1 molybdopterin molybdotransferase MoeA [Verrucomicrobiota bacterium]
MESNVPTIAEASIDEACRCIAGLCSPLEAEPVPLTQASGRCLRDSVVAPEDLPPFDRSAMDGYAFRHDDPSIRFVVVDRLRAGDWRPRALRIGEAVAIATGAALPSAGLQVIPRELVIEQEGAIELRQRPNERYIRRQGEDAHAGTVLARAGTRLNAGILALLASLGYTQPRVARKPIVWHILTGDELVEPDQVPGPGQIRDSNATLVRALLAEHGIVPHQIRLPEDEMTCLRALEPVRRNEQPVDLLLCSGGASVGPHDFTRSLLTTCGFDIVIHKVQARPGRPLIVGRRKSALAFGLPGNPLAHFVCLQIYVRTALRAWEGVPNPEPCWRTGRLAAPPATKSAPVETLWPARWQVTPTGMVELEPLPWQSSGDLTVLASANALIRVPPHTINWEVGTLVRFLPTDSVS